MKVQTQVQGNACVVAAHGPLITDDLTDLRRAVDSAPKTKRLIVDLADVPYVDSGGISLLLELCGTHMAAHQRPKLAALTETCMEALDLTDVLPRLEVFDTVENALRSCQR